MSDKPTTCGTCQYCYGEEELVVGQVDSRYTGNAKVKMVYRCDYDENSYKIGGLNEHPYWCPLLNNKS